MKKIGEIGEIAGTIEPQHFSCPLSRSKVIAEIAEHFTSALDGLRLGFSTYLIFSAIQASRSDSRQAIFRGDKRIGSGNFPSFQSLRRWFM